LSLSMQGRRFVFKKNSGETLHTWILKSNYLEIFQWRVLWTPTVKMKSSFVDWISSLVSRRGSIWRCGLPLYAHCPPCKKPQIIWSA
jgi:hypothetical protein